ncbi:MAG: hypothetical protein ABIQ73_13825 [Acidimicrobiales bacterium]
MAGSETPRPGWWRARDGNWYPPEALPEGWFIDADGGARQRQPVPPARSEPLPIRTPTYTTPPPRGPTSRRWRIAAAVAAILVIGAAAVIVTRSNGDDGVGDRAETGTGTGTPSSATLEASRLEPTTLPTTTLKIPAAPTQPPPTPPPPMCAASMSNPSPPQDAVVSVVVGSNQPNTPVQITVAYRTTTASFGATTDTAGGATTGFSVGKATVGFTVQVNVTVGQAACSTSFTTR